MRMPIHKICDTNVFRYIGTGELNPDKLTSDGSTIYYSPLTVLELSSRYNENSFEHRKAAAKAILDTKSKLLPDPETYLTRDIFGFTLSEEEFDWSHAVHAMAQSSSLEELQHGVADYNAGVRRRVNLTYVKSYRDGIDRDTVQDMLTIQKQEIPGFSTWWNPDPLSRTGNAPKLSGKNLEDFLQQTQDVRFAVGIIEACRDRALSKTNDRWPWPPTKEWVNTLAGACVKLAFYGAVYTEYVLRLLTIGMLPKVNDWWDREITIYSSSDDHIIVTSEKKWKSIATDAGFGQRVEHFTV